MQRAGTKARRCKVCGEKGHDKRNCPGVLQESDDDDDDSDVEVIIILLWTFVSDICLFDLQIPHSSYLSMIIY